MFSIIYDYLTKKKIQQSKYASYPLLNKCDCKFNIIYNCFTNSYEWYH